jgi:superfamily II DNA or RNA helicase
VYVTQTLFTSKRELLFRGPGRFSTARASTLFSQNKKQKGAIMNKFELRPYQANVVREAIAALLDGRPTAITMPTGAGKTVTAMTIIKQMRESGVLTGKVSWVSHRRKLLKQGEDAAKLLGVKDIEFLSMFVNTDDIKPSEMVIVEEAHRDSCSTMLSLHDTLAAKYILGLTATPSRQDGAKLMFSKFIRESDYHNLITLGYLSKFNLWTIPTWHPHEVATQYINNKAEFGKTAIFFLTSAECNDCEKYLREAGVATAFMHGGIPEDERDIMFEHFHEGKIEVLLSVALLTEGFDEPTLKTVFVRPVSSTGKGIATQMAGRALRLYKGQVKNIVESGTSGFSFFRVARPVDQHVWVPEDKQWRSVKPNDVADSTAKEYQEKTAIAAVTAHNTNGKSAFSKLLKK